ncbi:FG-GAP-like repeat-containing protein [bacterium]|nr:FG-GAP-like repeat-containing protein [bacterium]
MPEWAPPCYSIYPGAADLDGDGDTDLLFKYDGMQNDGGCDVGPWVHNEAWCEGLPDGGECVIAKFDLADLDADGDADLLAGCSYGSVLFYENTGTSLEPEWTRNDDYFYTDFSNFRSPAAVDLDGDGDLDIVSGVSGGTTRLIVHWNDGTPQEPVWIEDREFFSSIAPAGISVDPNFADIDLDGDLDLVTLPIFEDDAPLGVYENVGTVGNAIWEENPGLLTGVAQEPEYYGGVLTDLNCDGRPDLVMVLHLTGPICYRNDGPVTAVEQTSWGLIKALYR